VHTLAGLQILFRDSDIQFELYIYSVLFEIFISDMTRYDNHSCKPQLSHILVIHFFR